MYCVAFKISELEVCSILRYRCQGSQHCRTQLRCLNQPLDSWNSRNLGKWVENLKILQPRVGKTEQNNLTHDRQLILSAKWYMDTKLKRLTYYNTNLDAYTNWLVQNWLIHCSILYPPPASNVLKRMENSTFFTLYD